MHMAFLQVFHQGQGDGVTGDGWLWMTKSEDGTNWAGDTRVPNTGLSGGPGAVVFNEKGYVFHEGRNNGRILQGQLWVNVFDGTKWVGDTQVPNTGTFEKPSAVVFKGKL